MMLLLGNPDEFNQQGNKMKPFVTLHVELYKPVCLPHKRVSMSYSCNCNYWPMVWVVFLQLRNCKGELQKWKQKKSKKSENMRPGSTPSNKDWGRGRRRKFLNCKKCWMRSLFYCFALKERKKSCSTQVVACEQRVNWDVSGDYHLYHDRFPKPPHLETGGSFYCPALPSLSAAFRPCLFFHLSI